MGIIIQTTKGKGGEVARIEHRTLIKASLEEAFDYVVEPANRPNWIGSVLEVTGISEGPTGVGTSWNEKQSPDCDALPRRSNN